DPAASRPLGIIGDAQIELGRYPDAVKTLQQMVDLRPDLSSYARVSYIRELLGDVEGAIAAMQQAIEAGGPVPENSAYTRVLLANIYFNGGRLAEAETQAERALIDDPKYPYALATLAKIDAARGRYANAIARYQQAVDRYPLPDFVIGLADTYATSGDAAKAQETSGLAASSHAVRLGTHDAGMFVHRGMLEARLGLRAAPVSDLQQALHITPYFSLLWAPVAQQALDSLG